MWRDSRININAWIISSSVSYVASEMVNLIYHSNDNFVIRAARRFLYPHAKLLTSLTSIQRKRESNSRIEIRQ